MPVESAHAESTWHGASAITRLIEIRKRSARRNLALRHNNSFNPTLASEYFIIKVGGFCYPV
jgi:hypothetical protein